MTPHMVNALTHAINAQIESAFRHLNGRSAGIKAEVVRLEREAGNLVRFLAAGNESMTVRDELKALETALLGLRLELSDFERASEIATPRVHQAWVMARLERLEEMLRQDPVRARTEIAKHLDGDLVVWPKPSEPEERRAEVVGRAKGDSLLRDQEAVCLQLVAGARYIRTAHLKPIEIMLD